MIQKDAPHKQHQVMIEIITYPPIQRMLQSLWRKGQQQWRNGCCSQQEDSGHIFYGKTVCINRASIHHGKTARINYAFVHLPWMAFESGHAGTCQFFKMYIYMQVIQENSKQPASHTRTITNQLLHTHTINHERCQETGDEPGL